MGPPGFSSSNTELQILVDSCYDHIARLRSSRVHGTNKTYGSSKVHETCIRNTIGPITPRALGSQRFRHLSHLYLWVCQDPGRTSVLDRPVAPLVQPVHGSTHLQPVSEHHDRGVLERVLQRGRGPLLLPPVVLTLGLVALLAGEGRARRRG